MKNEDIGYDEYFESERKKLNSTVFPVARVITQNKGSYRVKNLNGEYMAKVTGKKIFKTSKREEYPAVGDWVTIDLQDSEWAVINDILPRKTIIKRKNNFKNDIQIIATNIDMALIVESIGRDFNLNRIERYLALANEDGIKSAIILNKIDLEEEKDINLKLNLLKNRFNGIAIILSSVKTNKGIEKLASYISPGLTYCFLGSSGVGKSSLINKLLGTSAIETGSIGLQNNRGKHVTTSREMYFLKNGGIVIDNPGMREVGITDDSSGVDDTFVEINILAKQCKYSDCSHTSEPGCHVLSVLKSGELDKEKYNNYLNLKKVADFFEMSVIEKNEKDYKFGKFIKKAKKEVKKYKDN